MALRHVAVMLALLAGPAEAEGVKLDGAGISKALVGVALVYDDGTSQSFAGDGGTVFEGGRGSSNGRWRVTGNLEVVSGTGRTVNRGARMFLCRCGQSGNKPYCDGSHERVGFVAEGV